MKNPDGNGYQISYETDTSRKVVHGLKKDSSSIEEPPHGAGSFHNPEQHLMLMDRITKYIKGAQS